MASPESAAMPTSALPRSQGPPVYAPYNNPMHAHCLYTANLHHV